MQRDPLGFAGGGMGLYGAFKSNPVIISDSKGLQIDLSSFIANFYDNFLKNLRANPYEYTLNPPTLQDYENAPYHSYEDVQSILKKFASIYEEDIENIKKSYRKTKKKYWELRFAFDPRCERTKAKMISDEQYSKRFWYFNTSFLCGQWADLYFFNFMPGGEITEASKLAQSMVLTHNKLRIFRTDLPGHVALAVFLGRNFNRETLIDPTKWFIFEPQSVKGAGSCDDLMDLSLAWDWNYGKREIEIELPSAMGPNVKFKIISTEEKSSPFKLSPSN